MKSGKRAYLGLVVKDLENLSEESFEKQELVSGRTLEKGFGLRVLPEERGITEKLLFQEYLWSIYPVIQMKAQETDISWNTCSEGERKR